MALGKLTEAEGPSKHNTRFRSKASLTAQSFDLRHDHVFGKKKMIKSLIDQPNRADEILSVAVGCTVTKQEHNRLHDIEKEFPDLDGWERYKSAGVSVVDMTSMKPIE